MKKFLKVGNTNILITITPTGQTPGEYQYRSSKYDIWCFDNTWEEAQENLLWILQDKVNAYVHCPLSKLNKLNLKEEKRKWKLYNSLFEKEALIRNIFWKEYKAR